MEISTIEKYREQMGKKATKYNNEYQLAGSASALRTYEKYIDLEEICKIAIRGQAAEMEANENKALFIAGLAGLLRQTREEVVDLALSEDGETVTILFEGGAMRRVDIACDSRIAIIKDVIKAI